MKDNNLAEQRLAKYCLTSISKVRLVSFLKGGVKKVTSVLLMLVFTVCAFVVLVVSIVLMTAELVISVVLSQAKAEKKGTLQDLLKGDRFSPSQFSQTK